MMEESSSRIPSDVMSTAIPTPDSPPKQVSRFEAALLRIARFFFRQIPSEEAIPLVRQPQDRPNCLSAAAVHLVRDTLSKGCILYLVRTGGWKKERFLRNGQPKAGRLWERSDVEELTLDFSRHAMEFLIWLTANKPTETKPMWKAPASELNVADHLLLFLAYESLREERDIAGFLRGSPAFAANGLCRLFYPGDFAGEPSDDAPNFDAWLTSTGGLIIEAPAADSRSALAGNRTQQRTDRRLGTNAHGRPRANSHPRSVPRCRGSSQSVGPVPIPACGLG